MSVFSKMGNFLNKHRKKFFVGGVIVSASILLTRYAQYRIRDWQQKEAKEFYERSRKQQHFESTERTCNQTILSLMVALNESLNKSFNVEDIISELRDNPDNKVELWNKLKVSVFSKVSTLIYVGVMLVITLRLQLNILGGYLYKDPNCLTLEMQEKYLSLCHSLLNSGVPKLSKLFLKEYEKVLDVLPLNRQLRLADLEKLFWATQVALKENEGDPIKNLRQYVILDEVAKSSDIVRDTTDLLDSEEIISITSSCISRGFSLVGDQVAEFYGPATSSDTFVHPADIKIPLAKLIPIINGLVNKNSLMDILIQQLLVNDKLKMLGANVYEAFSFTK